MKKKLITIFGAVDAEGNRYQIEVYTDYMAGDAPGLRRYVTTDGIAVSRIKGTENEYEILVEPSTRIRVTGEE